MTTVNSKVDVERTRGHCSVVGIAILMGKGINSLTSDLGNLSPLEKHGDVCPVRRTGI